MKHILLLVVVASLAPLFGACAKQPYGSTCSSNSDCGAGLVCGVVQGDMGILNVCVDPQDMAPADFSTPVTPDQSGTEIDADGNQDSGTGDAGPKDAGAKDTK